MLLYGVSGFIFAFDVKKINRRTTMPLIEYLEQLRERVKKIGARAIADKTGIAKLTIENFVSGKNTTAKTMVAVENACAELERVE